MEKITMEFTFMEVTMLSLALRPKVQEATDNVMRMLDIPWEDRDENWQSWYEKEQRTLTRWTSLRNGLWEQEQASRDKDDNPYI